MAIAAGPCPSCGAEIPFPAGSSIALVCPYCKHVVVRDDRAGESALRALGKVADVTFGDLSLAPTTRGKFRGRAFEVRGRVVLQHPLGGQWEEYFVVFDGDKPGWIAQAQGKWSVTQQVDVALDIDATTLGVGDHVVLGAAGEFVVVEHSEGTFVTAEGELPFATPPGEKRPFVDLSGRDGAWATIDLDADGTRIFVGYETTYDELHVGGAAAPTPTTKIETSEIKCPKCGGPISLHGGDDIERVGCSYCGALFEAKTLTILRDEQTERNKPRIALGTRFDWSGTEFILIGYVERSGVIDGDRFHWSEYLAYAPTVGYRWMIDDEGTWWWGTPIAAGDVEELGLDVSYRGKRFRQRNENPAQVDYVVGEFYWQVAVGETVEATDFELGRELVSREQSGTEVNWTFSAIIPPRTMREKFDIGDAGASPPSDGGGGGGGSGSSGLPPWLPWVAIVGIMIFFGLLGECGGGSGGGGGWGGGFGGK